MKIASAALAAVLLAGIGWSVPAHAQRVPQGSYLTSCSDVRVEGDTLVARCRTRDGRERRSALAGINRCVGDIGNNNGTLQCNLGRGPPPRVQGGPAPGFGERRADERDIGERCRGLRREAEELRERLGREFNPLERARTEGRLREVGQQEERCR